MLKTSDIGLERGSGGSVKLNLTVSPTMFALRRCLAWATCHFSALRTDLSVMLGPSRGLFVAMFFGPGVNGGFAAVGLYLLIKVLDMR